MGAAALLFLMAVAVVFAFNIHISAQGLVSFLAMGLIGSTITYLGPGTGTTPPTTAQAANVQSLAVTVNFGDADTTATVTHNFQSSAAALLALRPWVNIYAAAGGTAYPALSWALGANAVVITKGNATSGSGGTYNVIIQRPWTPLASNIPSMP
jgi:hypothetical protein